VLASRRAAMRRVLWPVEAAALLLGLGVWVFVGRGGVGRVRAALRQHKLAYAYIFPAMAAMFVLVFLPLLYGVTLAFFRRVQHREWSFAGLDNFIEVLSDTRITNPESFYYTLGVTVLWTVVNVSLHVGIGLSLALILNRPRLRWKRLYRVILILPWAIPNYITALIWKGMFHRQFGAINAFLEWIGLESISWFNSFWTAFAANVMTNTWLGFPFMMVISLGALQSIPGELYEAAEVDGAGRWQQLRTITLPLLKPALFPAIILGTIWTFNMFNIIYLVSNGAPNGATDILIVEAYRYAFQRSAWGIAAAYSIIIFVILMLYSVVTNRITRATEGAFD
jgi:arabinogalactan oligomer/maltooligosaccharide transport system permease protein